MYFIEISSEFQLNFNGFPYVFLSNFNLISNLLKFTMVSHWNFNWIFAEFPMDFHWYFTKISNEFQQNFQRISNISLKFQLNFWLISNGLPNFNLISNSLRFPMVFHWNFNWISAWFPMNFYLYFTEFQMNFIDIAN